MKKLILLLILILLSSQYILSQEIVAIKADSILLEELFTHIEKNTTYKIYAVIEEPLTISVNVNNESPIDLLRTVLKETPYNISIYKNNIYIHRGEPIKTSLTASLLEKDILNNDTTSNESLFSYRINKIEKSTSRNLLYVIGDPHTKEIPPYVTLTGKITDFKTDDPLQGINIIHNDPWIASVTDAKGNFTIKLPSGRIRLNINGLNIADTRRELLLYADGSINIELEEMPHMLDEITVTSGRIENIKSTQMGVEKLQVARIKNIPMALGEVDLLKVIQSLPGVKTVGEASSGYNVRGGATDQNLILLNEGTIYNPNHLFGFFTAFNSDMIKEADLYKSSIPSKYGGRISSILDITSREANKEKFTGSAGIGLVTSKLNLEIPLIKEKTSLLLSGRTTYSDWILKKLPEKSGYKNGTAGFYDLGTVLSHKFNNKNLLNIYGYYSRDRFAFNDDQKYSYNNLNASAKWRRVLNNKLTGYFTLGYDHYNYSNTETVNTAAAYKLSFDINQTFGKLDFIFDYSDKIKFDFGLKTMHYNLNPGTFSPVGEESLVNKDKLQKDKALESAAYIGSQWEITPKFSIDAGIRYSVFNALGPRTYIKYQDDLLPSISSAIDTITVGSGKSIKTYHGPEFRLSGRYAFNDNFSIKAGFNSMRQYIHKLSNTAIMSPTDIWKLSDSNIQPQKGWQVAAGLYANTPNGIWQFALEGYYKQMTDYLDYRSGANLIMNHHIETDVIPTEGKAYGIEFSLKKLTGKLNGWLSYTYSRTFLQQNSRLISKPVNNGDWYPTQYDKPHDFKFVGNYKFTERYSISVNLDYSTGRPITIPEGEYYNHQLNTKLIYYGDRNSYRIPDYFRTDIAFNIEPSHKLTLLTHHTLSFGVYNLTGRKNVYSIYFASEEGKIKGYKMSIFGVPIPFITYNIKF